MAVESQRCAARAESGMITVWSEEPARRSGGSCVHDTKDGATATRRRGPPIDPIRDSADRDLRVGRWAARTEGDGGMAVLGGADCASSSELVDSEFLLCTGPSPVTTSTSAFVSASAFSRRARSALSRPRARWSRSSRFASLASLASRRDLASISRRSSRSTSGPGSPEESISPQCLPKSQRSYRHLNVSLHAWAEGGKGKDGFVGCGVDEADESRGGAAR